MRTPKFHELNQSPFYRLRSPDTLAALINLPRGRLDSLSESADAHYDEYEIEQKPGKKRHIEEPRAELKAVQARLAKLLSRIRAADYLFCPAKRRCYIANAAQHRNSRVVHCLDITKFFANTPRHRVYAFFANVMECAPDVAARLASLATFRGHLPTGSPLSPIAAHYAYSDVWQALAKIATAHGLTLTIYVDDVTVSGPTAPTSVVWQMKQVIHASGLRYHKEKRYVDKPADITGVILRDGKLLVPNRQLLKHHIVSKASEKSTGDECSLVATPRLRGLEAQASQIRRWTSLK